MHTIIDTNTPEQNLITTDFTITLKDTVSNVDKNVNFYTILFTWKQKKIWKTTPKRFSEFEAFHNLIKYVTNDPCIINLPPKLLVHTKENLEERKKGLTNYIYSITKSSYLIQIPEVRQFFEIPFVVQLYYAAIPMQLPVVENQELPENVRQMYQDGCTWTTHFNRMYTSVHQLPTFEEQDEFFMKNRDMINNMRQFFEIQMQTFTQVIKEQNIQILKDIFSTSHRIWLWIVNMPQIIHAMNVLAPPTFIDIMKYLNKSTGELDIPASVTTSTGDSIKDYFNQITSIKKRGSELEAEVVKNGFVLSSYTKKRIIEISEEIDRLIEGVISYNQFINGDNCMDVKEMYIEATNLDIAFSKRLGILIDKKPENECLQKASWIEAKGSDNQVFMMQELYQPFVL
ncbi:hypothetical protein EDI_310480 [Entamoeba dispar SAW760]|uniref:PX domain-containing protein n=1 Tax=Entamoeba dispar (strain ATCC PRA-260 / SAW760) TaxID=370354 RepID=B0ENV8_ENTDS|nr:uncharacterized protein EDI_310480 [Entamoeba dispar SAW760]EDR23797.1 hypothetical protein EDI_310480 [Entamoeba dispar SAW760]|eukprot:EDR23797.1 hypothetical protein EDI_310480 [Entamoeba dispar SAW760]